MIPAKCGKLTYHDTAADYTNRYIYIYFFYMHTSNYEIDLETKYKQEDESEHFAKLGFFLDWGDITVFLGGERESSA